MTASLPVDRVSYNLEMVGFGADRGAESGLVVRFPPIARFLQHLKELEGYHGFVSSFVADDGDTYVEAQVATIEEGERLSAAMANVTWSILEETGDYVGLICDVAGAARGA